ISEAAAQNGKQRKHGCCCWCRRRNPSLNEEQRSVFTSQSTLFFSFGLNACSRYIVERCS
ncbi:unnamed protein product, partial [Brassica rapa subsp. trilocularis]